MFAPAVLVVLCMGLAPAAAQTPRQQAEKELAQEALAEAKPA